MKPVKFHYYVRLTRQQFLTLRERLATRFKFLTNENWHRDVTYKPKAGILTFKFAPMGRSLYPDESCDAYPFKLGKAVAVDSIRTEQIGCFIEGYLLGIGV